MIPLRDAMKTTIAGQMRPAQEQTQVTDRTGKISAAWMGGAVDLEQPLGIDGCIDLRGREGGMPKQLLDRAQISAA
jgi:hypothetical protein